MFADGRIQKAELLQGNKETVDAHNKKLASDPVTGELGELGFGTQILRFLVVTFRTKRFVAPFMWRPGGAIIWGCLDSR